MILVKTKYFVWLHNQRLVLVPLINHLNVVCAPYILYKSMIQINLAGHLLLLTSPPAVIPLRILPSSSTCISHTSTNTSMFSWAIRLTGCVARVLAASITYVQAVKSVRRVVSLYWTLDWQTWVVYEKWSVQIDLDIVHNMNTPVGIMSECSHQPFLQSVLMQDL